MKEFIIRHFVKNPEDLRNPQTRESYGSVAGAVGIVSNLILCIFKIASGLIFSSISILADGINNLSDAAASLITMVGFKLAGKKADADHPYGHGRTEYLTGLIVSVMVMVIGVTLFKSSLEKTLHPEELDFSWITIVILIVAISIKLWQTSFNVHIGKLIESEALTATAADSRNDVISTSAVLLATIVSRLTGYNLDGPVGILVSLFILYSGIGLVRDTISPILGQAPDPKLVKEISDILTEDSHVLGIHDLIVHDYGPGRLFASCHVEVDASRNIFEIHDAIDNIEKEVHEKLNVLMTLHMDPVDVKDPARIKVKKELEKIISEIDGIMNFHDVRVVSGPTHINVVFDVVADYECKLSDNEIKEEIQKRLSEFDPKYIAVITIDRRYA